MAHARHASVRSPSPARAAARRRAAARASGPSASTLNSARVPVRIRGRSLGLNEGDAAALAKLVEAGFTYSKLEDLRRNTGFSVEEIARFAQIPKRTLSRRQSDGRLKADESDRLLRLAGLFDLATDLFEGDHARARAWLAAPQHGLDGQAPLARAATEVGARDVEDLLLRLQHGVIA